MFNCQPELERSAALIGLLEDRAFELSNHERPVNLLLGRQRTWIGGANLMQQRLLRCDPSFDRRAAQVGGRSAWHLDESLNEAFESVAGRRPVCLYQPRGRHHHS